MSKLREMVCATGYRHLLVFVNFVCCQSDFGRESFAAVWAWVSDRRFPFRIDKDESGELDLFVFEGSFLREVVEQLVNIVGCFDCNGERWSGVVVWRRCCRLINWEFLDFVFLHDPFVSVCVAFGVAGYAAISIDLL